MEAFRAIPPNNIVNGTQPRITTSNVGMLYKAPLETRIRGLNKFFYNMVISSKTVDNYEIQMLSNLNKDQWYKPLRKELKLEEEEKDNIEKLK